MPIYEIDADRLRLVQATTFSAEGLYERRHLQTLLRDSIGAIEDRLMVLAEEFGEWLDSSRRIDLLCLDSDANLVVVELKRTEDGGHMELQALRYAAMVSAMTFDQAAEALSRHRNQSEPNLEDARASILQFLAWSEVREDQFAQDTRIILAAADFGKEVTTTVMWLNERGLDIRCVRLKPYRMEGGATLLDIQQLIPLPEAATFQTQLGVKKQAERRERVERHDLRYQFWTGLLALSKNRTQTHANRRPSKDTWIGGAFGRGGFTPRYFIRQTDCHVDLSIYFGSGAREKNKKAFHALLSQRAEIERDFGAALIWEDAPGVAGASIRYELAGGYRSPPEQWPNIQERLVDAMVRLDGALRERVAALQF